MTRPGFTLVEILIVVIILGILAAIVVPQFSSASQAARNTALKDILRMVRSQSELYRTEHAGRSPGYPAAGGAATEAMFKAQMLGYTSLDGTVSVTKVAGYKGPYLLTFPINPLNSLDSVQMIGDAEELPDEPSNASGWVYKPSNCKFRADSPGHDENGKNYYDY